MLQIIAADPRHREALENLVMICLQTGRPDAAQDFLGRLTAAYPAQPLYCDRLATLLGQRGRNDDAIACYRRLLAARPSLTNSRYNLAKLLKRGGYLQEALQEYRHCLQRKIEHPEEVHTNISVIQTSLHQHEQARQSLNAAIACNPRYIPALFNLALLQEEQGNWEGASTQFKRILKLDSLNAGALAHIANGERVTDADSPVIARLEQALQQNELASAEKEELHYALGKVFDDCQHYDKAFAHYQTANQLSTARCGAYDRAAQEHCSDQLITTFDQRWLDSIEPVSQAPLVFICGMFRSGSTLLEQILSAHPAITAGGEIDFFQTAFRPFPNGLLQTDRAAMASVGNGYLEYLAGHFPAGARVSNKRPDNFFCLGLLKGLFPNARFINTLRQPLDNCLSLFFQPLEYDQPYANALLDSGHYYRQYLRLMQHWRPLLGDALLDISYETLVESPEEIIGEALTFLALDWDDRCLDFHRADNRVRTASVHQVRQPLYQAAIGRWQNYAAHIGELQRYMRESGA